MKNVIAMMSGVIFAIGLGISGMLNPQKVSAFLDVTSVWDPSLAFVMLGGIGLNMILFLLILKRQKPVLANEFSLPKKKELDKPLIIGAAMFGLGWGMAGLCPGPVLANLITLKTPVLIFFASLFIGFILYQVVNPEKR